MAGIAVATLVLGSLLPAGAEETAPLGNDSPTTSTPSEPTTTTTTVAPADEPSATSFGVESSDVGPLVDPAPITVTLHQQQQGQTPIEPGTGDCQAPDDGGDIPNIPAGQMIWHFILTNTTSVNGVTSEGSAGYPTDMISALTLDFAPDTPYTVVQTKVSGVFHWWVQTPDTVALESGSVSNVVPDVAGNGQPKTPNFNLSHCEFPSGGDDGSLTVDKEVVGTPSGDPTFTINVACDTDPAIDVDLTFDASGNLDPAGQDNVFEDLPPGTQCTVEEQNPPSDAQVAYTVDGSPVSAPATVTILAAAEVDVVVTNTFTDAETGSISVQKEISGQFGEPTIGDEYDVRVRCVDGDQPPAIVFDQTVTLTYDSKMSHNFTGIPVPSSCTVEETAMPAQASLLSYSPHGTDPDEATTPPTIELGDTTSASVTITNAYSEVGGEFSGSVNVAKHVVGGPPDEGTEFVINVKCDGVTVHVDQDVTLVYKSKLTDTVSFSAPSLETVTCTVTEKSPLGGATRASVSPNDGVVVLTVAAPSADVVVTNEYGDPKVEVGGVSVTDALPFTGSGTDILLKVAGWLIVLGAGLWVVTRIRRRGATQLG